MNNGLSDTSDEKKFYDLQKAIADNDFDKINDLMKAPDQTDPVTEPVAEVVVTEPVASAIPEDTTASPAQADTAAGPSNPDTPVGQDPATPEVPDTAAAIAALEQKLEAATQQLHRYKSDAGRVPALQKRMAELEKRLKPTSDASQTDALSDEEKRVLDDLRNNDPVLAEHVEKLTKNVASRTDSLRQQLEERLRTADQEEYEQIIGELERIEYGRLQEMLPQVPLNQVFTSNEWKSWKRTLRPSELAYAESSDADQVYAAIQWFGQAMQASRAAQTPPQAPATPTPTPVAQAQPPAPRAAPAVRSSVAAQQPGRALSMEEEFSAAYKYIGERDGLDQPKPR